MSFLNIRMNSEAKYFYVTGGGGILLFYWPSSSVNAIDDIIIKQSHTRKDLW